MFVRRHPILFFFLVVCGIGAVMIISVAALFLFGKRDSTFEFRDKVGLLRSRESSLMPKQLCYN